MKKRRNFQVDKNQKEKQKQAYLTMLEEINKQVEKNSKSAKNKRL